MKRCRTCLLPDTKPGLYFDESGQCSACTNYFNRPEIDWEQRETTLRDILANAKPGPSGHNLIVPSSGGKDSSAQALRLIELGARPLIVTASTCHLTPLGRKNIDNLARFATTVEITPNRTVRKKINRIGLELLGDISMPEHMAIFSVPFRAARDFQIPLIFYGENSQHEYGGPLGSEEALTMTRRWVSEHGGLLGMRPVDFVGMDGITKEDMLDYMLPSDEAMADVDAFFLGQFLPWDSRKNAELAIEHGFTTGAPSPANYWNFENLDNAQTGIHDFFCYIKYGYGRLCAQISVDIRRGLIRRDQALDIVRANDGLFPYRYAGVTIDEMLTALDRDMSWMRDQIQAHMDHSLFDGWQGDRPVLKEFIEEVA